MGLRDRGCCRERERECNRSNINRNLFRDYDKPTSPMHPLLRGVLSVLMLVVIYGFYSFFSFYIVSYQKEFIDFLKVELTKSEPIKQLPVSYPKPFKFPESVPNPAIATIPKPMAQPPVDIVLHADSSGHYRGTLFVNNVAMPFMIDTGATYTAIPTKMAYVARLPIGQAYQVSTSNGLAVAHKTQINSFKIDSINIRNLEASTLDRLDVVLVGMNTLKLFQMTQDRNTLILSAYADELAINGSSATEVPVHIAKKTWMKTVTCDANKQCKTSYR